MIAPDREVTNAATGERVRFVRTADETGGELLVMENEWTRPDHAVPEHVHPGMEERWHVLDGTAGFRIDGEETIAGPGESVAAPPGSAHTAWNAGGDRVLLRIEMRPALRWEDFVSQLFALASEELEGPLAERSVEELLTEFAPEIRVIPPGSSSSSEEAR